MPAQSESLLAIVLNPKRLSAADVHFVGDDLHVTLLGDIKPPDGAFDGTQIASGELLGRAILAFLTEKRVVSRKAVIVLPDGAAITQLIKLPTMPRDDMLGAVRSVAERYAVFAEHDIAVDCAVVEEVEEDGARMSNVLFAASRVANVEQCQECARVAGLELVAVEAPAVAAARAYRERFPQSQVVALSIIGAAKTDVMIFDNGVLRLCYSANAGLPQETEQGDWISPIPEDSDPFATPPQLYSELTHCLRFFQNQFPTKAVQRALVTADHPKAELIVSHLAEQLQIPVELGRPSSELRLPPEVDETTAASSRAFTLALFRGAALSAVGERESLFPINLLPPSRAAWTPALPAIKIGAVLMAVMLVGAILWSISIGQKVALQEDVLNDNLQEIAVLQPELDVLRAARATEQALRNEVERATAKIARERAVRWSQILIDASEHLPRDMWLTELSSPDSSRITFTGIATNRETIPGAIESLSESPYLNSVVLGSLSSDDTYAPGREVIRYQLNARLLRGLLGPPPTAAPAVPAGGSQEATR